MSGAVGVLHEYETEIQRLHGVEPDVPAELHVVGHPVHPKKDHQGGQRQPCMSKGGNYMIGTDIESSGGLQRSGWKETVLAETAYHSRSS